MVLEIYILALANRQGAGGMADLNIGADAGTERNADDANLNRNQNVHGGNVGGAYQEGVAPAAAAAAAANNGLNNNANAENADNARANRAALRRGAEEEGIRRTVGNWQSGMQQIKWLRRIYVQQMKRSRLQTVRNTVYVAGQREMEHYRREMRKKPTMISTMMPGSSTVSRNVTHVRGQRAVGRTRSSNALPGNSGSQANNRAAAQYRTRAVREREQQDIDEEEEDDHSATSVSSDSSDGTLASTLAEDQLSSSSDSDDSQSSAYSDWVNPVCSFYRILDVYSLAKFTTLIEFLDIILGC